MKNRKRGKKNSKASNMPYNNKTLNKDIEDIKINKRSKVVTKPFEVIDENINMEDLISVEEFAKALNRSKATIYNWLKKDYIKPAFTDQASKIDYFSKQQLLEVKEKVYTEDKNLLSVKEFAKEINKSIVTVNEWAKGNKEKNIPPLFEWDFIDAFSGYKYIKVESVERIKKCIYLKPNKECV